MITIEPQDVFEGKVTEVEAFGKKWKVIETIDETTPNKYRIAIAQVGHGYIVVSVSSTRAFLQSNDLFIPGEMNGIETYYAHANTKQSRYSMFVYALINFTNSGSLTWQVGSDGNDFVTERNGISIELIGSALIIFWSDNSGYEEINADNIDQLREAIEKSQTTPVNDVYEAIDRFLQGNFT